MQGTVAFLAPELIESIWNKKMGKYNPFKSDVFSLGLVILNYITGIKFNHDDRFNYCPEVYSEIL